MSEAARRPDVAECSAVGELKIRFLATYEKCPQFVADAGSKWRLKSIQYERHMPKGRAEDGRISLDVLNDVAAGFRGR